RRLRHSRTEQAEFYSTLGCNCNEDRPHVELAEDERSRPHCIYDGRAVDVVIERQVVRKIRSYLSRKSCGTRRKKCVDDLRVRMVVAESFDHRQSLKSFADRRSMYP